MTRLPTRIPWWSQSQVIICHAVSLSTYLADVSSTCCTSCVPKTQSWTKIQPRSEQQSLNSRVNIVSFLYLLLMYLSTESTARPEAMPLICLGKTAIMLLAKTWLCCWCMIGHEQRASWKAKKTETKKGGGSVDGRRHSDPTLIHVMCGPMAYMVIVRRRPAYMSLPMVFYRRVLIDVLSEDDSLALLEWSC